MVPPRLPLASSPEPCPWHQGIEDALGESKADRAAIHTEVRGMRDDLVELKTIAKQNSNAVRVYLWPVLMILLTAVGTYVSGRLAAQTSHGAPSPEVPRAAH